MLIQLVLKELSEHVKTLRFMLMLVLVMVLMAVSAVLYIPEYKERMVDFDRNNNAMLAKISEDASQTAAIFRVFSYNFEGAWVFERPNRLGFISDGKEQVLPNAFRPSAFRIYGPSKQVRSNILLGSHEALDWSTIIGLILSFFALVMVYDSVSGEREIGTLRLCLSNSVPRTMLLLSKFLGAFIAIAAALTVGVMIHLVILMSYGSIALDYRDWGIVGVAFCLSLLYVAVFLMLGLWISAKTKESSASLVIALICWAMLVIVIPGSGGYIATRLTGIKDSYKAGDEANTAEEQACNSYNEQHPELKQISVSGHWSPGEPLGRALEMGDAWTKVMVKNRNSMIFQVEQARMATLVSPYACYSLALEQLTESGLAHYKHFHQQMENYRLTMRQYLMDIYPQPLDWFAWNDDRAVMQRLLEKLDFNSLPKFNEQRSNPAVIAQRMLPFVSLLFLFGVIFFAGAYVSFIRYDVR